MHNQSRVIDFLAQAAGLAGRVEVERVDTHTAIVFLWGDRAWKMKREVRYDYLDFSTLELRRDACEAEVRLNRRTAPDLYLGVSAVTREADGTLALDGAGTPVEWLVRMRRFDQDALLDRLATRGALPLDLMPALADAVSELHTTAEPRPGHGGVDGMRWVVDGNASEFELYPADFAPPTAAAVTAASRAAIDRHADLLEARRAAGRVRQCHGDLHLRNVVCLEGRPVIFDCIEFNDRIACVDVLYDLAFLLMDLLRRGLPVHANLVFNRYCGMTDEDEALSLLPLFLSCRAAVRAKTSATAARLQTDAAPAASLRAASREYLERAASLVAPPPPCVVAIGGLSGTGKSTLARRLAPGLGTAPGALVLRSDEVRKQLLGRQPGERLTDAAYSQDVSALVYQRLAARTRTAAAAGHSVIVDAVHARQEARDAIERAARDAGAAFCGLWLEAPLNTMRGRLVTRRGDVSDATPAVLEQQARHGIGDLAWTRVDAGGDAAAAEAHARAALAAVHLR